MKTPLGLACAAVALGALASYGCSTEACSCASPDILVMVSEELAPVVASVRSTGPGCNNQQATCDADNSPPGPSCRRYAIHLSGEGECVVSVAFSDGITRTYEAEVTHKDDECCGGYYADSAHRTIEVK